MEKLTRFALTNARFTQVFIIMLFIIGISTFLKSPSKEDPEIMIRNAIVVAQFPGMSPDRIEKLITKPLEREIKQIPEVSEIKSWVRTGVTQINVSVHDKYFDLQPIWDTLRNRMEEIQNKLPEGTYGPYVNDEFGRVYSATIALTGNDFSPRERRRMAEFLQDKMSTYATISQVALYGVQDERIWLTPKDDTIAENKFSVKQIKTSLQARNVVLPCGTIDAGALEVVIEPSGNFESVEEIQNMVLFERDSGQSVYLRDLIDLSRGYEDPFKTPVFFNNQSAIVIAASMADGIRSDDFGADIESFLAEYQKKLPVGMALELATFQPEKVTASVSSATSNLMQTVVVVLAIVMLFLGVRMGLIVGSIVPLTILLTIIGMSVWGVELQRMSIAAIIIALGLLVDNGIVIAEFIKTKISEGMEKVEAAVLASKTMALPLLTSSLTSILAFMPLLLAQDVTGEYLRSLSQVITLALLASWFLCLFATPALCVWFLKAPKLSIKKDALKKETLLTQAYKNVIGYALNYRLLFISACVTLFFLAIFGLKFVTIQFMPGSERNQYLVFLNLPAGTTVTETTKVTRCLNAWLLDKEQNPDVTNTVAYIGDGGPRFFLALAPVDRATNRAFMVVNTTDTDSALEMVAKTNDFIIQELPEASGQAKRMWLGGTELGLIEYKVVGDDENVLRVIASQIENALHHIPGTIGIDNHWENSVPKITIDIDQTAAQRAGITSRDIAISLNSFLEGYEVTSYREDDDVIPVMIRGNDERNEIGKLFSMRIISTSSGEPLPLLQFADFSTERESAVIRREDLQRVMTVSVKHANLQASELNKLVQPYLQNLNLPDGYSIELGGELKGASKANGALFGYLPHCFAVMVLLLLLQFNSVRRPAIILLTIPLSLIGAVSGLLIMDAYFTFPAMLGIFSLAGIIINNGIVLIDCIESNRAEGMLIRDSIIDACMTRLRPIVMTTLTTILGLVPLAISGGEFWYSMSIVMIFGMAVGTLLTLGVVPVLYSLFFRANKYDSEAKV